MKMSIKCSNKVGFHHGLLLHLHHQVDEIVRSGVAHLVLLVLRGVKQIAVLVIIVAVLFLEVEVRRVLSLGLLLHVTSLQEVA